MTKYKIKYPNLKRLYIRTNAPILSEEYKNYLLQFYDNTYYPRDVEGAGKAIYVKRNIFMIDNCDLLIAYYREDLIKGTKSGTKTAVEYAKEKGKKIIYINHLIKS